MVGGCDIPPELWNILVRLACLLYSLQQPRTKFAKTYTQKSQNQLKWSTKIITQVIQKGAGKGKQRTKKQGTDNKIVDLMPNIPAFTLNVHENYKDYKHFKNYKDYNYKIIKIFRIHFLKRSNYILSIRLTLKMHIG